MCLSAQVGRARRAGLLVLLLVGLAAPSALAWRVGRCNQVPVRWAKDDVELALMRCSAPPGSHRAADLQAGIDGWRAVTGLGLELRSGPGPATCRIAINGRSELGYVEPAQLDGARAVTRLIFDRPCIIPSPGETWPATPHIVETDVAVADFDHDHAGPPENCDVADPNRPLRRALVLHELGHVIGLRHEDDHMAVMNTTASGGRYCGVRAMEPHPDDRAGARSAYPSDDAPVRDVAASAFHLARPGYARSVMDNRHVRVCPGQPLDVRWAVANQGTVDAHTRVRWFVSDNDIISRRDIPAGTSGDIVIAAGGFASETQRLVVPELPRDPDGESGPWWLGFIVDPDGPGFELPASNDWTYTGMRLWLRDPGECP